MRTVLDSCEVFWGEWKGADYAKRKELCQSLIDKHKGKVAADVLVAWFEDAQRYG